MPIINRKRRVQATPEPSPPPTRRRQSLSMSEAYSIDENVDGEFQGETQSGSSHDQMVKRLVRLALASEYSRQPIRRADITAKVMAPSAGRQFKKVFSEAQDQLRSVFGTELTELPQKEKITISQKRTAARTSSQASSASKAWVLTSTLAPRYRQPNVLSPAKIPSATAESSYIGLTTFILALIYLSPSSSISESRLEKQMKRMNADNYIFGEKTEKALKRMEREGYVIKVKERDGGGEETIDYMIGPRGRVEVGERGVAGLVRRVYNKKDAEADELERRLVRSLGDVVIEKKRRVAGEEEGEEEGREGDTLEVEQEQEQETQINGTRGFRKQMRRSSSRNKRRTRDEEDEEENEEEEAEESEEEEDDE